MNVVHPDGEDRPEVSGTFIFDDVFLPKDKKSFEFIFFMGFYVCVVVFSTLFNVLFFLLLTFSNQQFRKRPFVRVIWHVIVANLLTCLSNIMITVPLSFTISDQIEAEIFKNSVTYKIFKPLGSISVQLILFLTLVIAIQRVLVFVSPRSVTVLFEGKIFYVIMAVVWILAILIVLTLYFMDCKYNWNSFLNMFLFACEPFISSQTVRTVETLIYIESIAFPIAIAICYAYILTYIFGQRRGTTFQQQNSFEKEVLKQAALLFLIFEISSLFSLSIPNRRISLQSGFLVNRMDMTLILLAGAITPVLFISTSPEMRRQLRILNIRSWKVEIKILPVSMIKSRRNTRIVSTSAVSVPQS